MDDNKKVILKLYDMIRDCRSRVEDLEIDYEYDYDPNDYDPKEHCRDLKELGFDKMEIREILGINDGAITQMVDSIFEEHE